MKAGALLRSRRGSTRQPENSKRAHFRTPALQNTTKIPRKDPQERERRKKTVAGEGEEKREILGPHPSGLQPSGPYPLWSQNSTSNWPKSKLAEVKIGRSRSRSGGGCSTSANSLAQRRPFLLLWAVWASEALHGQGPVPSGRVGRIASPWFSRGALIWWDFVDELKGVPEAEHLRCAALATRRLDQGFEIHSWTSLMEGARPRDPEKPQTGWLEGKVGSTRHRLESVGEFRDVQLFPTIDDAQRALLQSQSGPGAGSCAPHLARLDSFTFRTLFCRPLRLPLPLTKHICRCGRRTDFKWPPPRNLCSVRGFCSSGFLQWKAWLPECAVKAG